MTIQSVDEFSLIKTYFTDRTVSRSDVLLGIGDDAALLTVPSGQSLVVCIDTLVEGVHFLPQADPEDVGHKVLAVNLSDLAAMGAEPCWMTLALTMPESQPMWLNKFSAGLFQLANQFNMQLIGGDTTRGALTVTVQAHGFVPSQSALTRQGARVGDKIYVSGTLGDAGLGLEVALGKRIVSAAAQPYVLQRLNKPNPQVKLGILLRHLATSAIDISDGLLADLGHLLEASHVGADIMTDKLPLSDAMKQYVSADDAKVLALTAGDDYELCFTVAPENEAKLVTTLRQEKIQCSCIGLIKKGSKLDLQGFSGALPSTGFRHF